MPSSGSVLIVTLSTIVMLERFAAGLNHLPLVLSLSKHVPQANRRRRTLRQGSPELVEGLRANGCGWVNLIANRSIVRLDQVSSSCRPKCRHPPARASSRSRLNPSVDPGTSAGVTEGLRFDLIAFDARL